ncbi:hypothetical protein QV08_08780, partial [Gallibacterium salpingitidis]
MKAKLKLISEQQGEFDLNTYIPDSQDIFSINIVMGIGIDDGSESLDYFDLTVCSLHWIKYYIKRPIILRHTMIINQYNFEDIKNGAEV